MKRKSERPSKADSSNTADAKRRSHIAATFPDASPGLLNSLTKLDRAWLQRIEFLHQHLELLHLTGQKVPALQGEKRAEQIRSIAQLVHERGALLPAQILAGKLLLNALCPGWEAEAPDLARMMATIPADHTWADKPIQEVSWH